MTPKRNTKPLAARINRENLFGTAEDLPRLFEVSLSDLRPNPDQPRQVFDEEALQELASSIEHKGLIQPIAVAPDPQRPRSGYIIVAGERRFRAFQALGRSTIPAILTTGDPAEITIIENVQRENLHPLEEAFAYSNLMDRHGYTQEDVAQIVGKGRRTVSELIGLTALPQTIQEECRTSGIPKSLLIEISRLESEEEQLAVWKAIQQDGLTVRAIRAQKKTGSAVRPQRDDGYKALRAGNGFVKALKKLADTEAGTDAELIRSLRKMQEQLDGLLQALTSKVMGS